MTTTTDLLSTPELCYLTGASYRQIDYWTRTGVLTPAVPATGQGSERGWSEASIAPCRALVALSIASGSNRRYSSLLPDQIGSQPPPWSVVVNGVRITVEVLP
jgi:hypothetical protein